MAEEPLEPHHDGRCRSTFRYVQVIAKMSIFSNYLQ